MELDADEAAGVPAFALPPLVLALVDLAPALELAGLAIAADALAASALRNVSLTFAAPPEPEDDVVCT